jgi:hypothetical protein
MNITYILFKKSFREGELIDMFIISMIIFFSGYKETFLIYSLIPIFFSNKIFNLIWANKNEKSFYSQFEENELKKISSSQQIQFIIEFNFSYLVLFLFTSFKLKGLNEINWIISNLFVHVNFIIGNLLFNKFFFLNASFNKLTKYSLLILANILTITLVFLIKIDNEFSLYSLLLTLLSLIFFRIYTLNSLLNNLQKIKFHD